MKWAPLLAWFFFYVVPPSTTGQWSPPFASRQRCEHGMVRFQAVFGDIVIKELCFDDGARK
jgi:hypothetical protein